MTREDRGIEYYDETTNTVLLGGVGGNPEDLGIEVKHPSSCPGRFSYRLTEDDVVRGGYGITVSPIPFSRPLRSFYPSVISNDFVSDSSYVPYRDLRHRHPAVLRARPQLGRHRHADHGRHTHPYADHVNRPTSSRGT